MNHVISFLPQILVVAVMLASILFEITSAGANSAGFTPLTASVRDLYSKEILFQAQPRLRFAQFAKVKEDFMTVQQGGAIVFTKYNNLTGGGTLSEDSTMPEVAMADSGISITVNEYGNGVKVSEKALQTSIHDTLGDASRLLANNLAVTIDTMFRDTVLGTTNILYGDGSLAGPANLGDNANTPFQPETVRAAVEVLASNNAPKFEGEYYAAFATPSQLRTLRSNSDWLEANRFASANNIFKGVAGMFEGVIFIETTQMPTYANAAAVNATAYSGATYDSQYHEAVFFGENAYGWGVAMYPELRDDGVVDYGRKHGLAWYGIWGAGILEQQNIVKVLTAKR